MDGTDGCACLRRGEALGHDGEDLLDEAEVEHGSIKDLVAQLEEGDAGDELYDAKVKVLSEYVKHHAQVQAEAC